MTTATVLPIRRSLAKTLYSSVGAFPTHQTWLFHHNGRSPLISSRGAKTRTVVKAGKLPQGLLPPLPRDDSQALVPEKTYPTVLQQHLNNVRKFKDCIVLTRIGDFYELYFDQVDQYAHLVNLKKAKRATALGDVPMAGFQHTQLDRYLKMFVQDLGKQVAISEQVRLPENERLAKAGSPMYDRKVTRIVTAGTLIDENFMDPYENNYLLAIHFTSALPGLPSKDQDRKAYESYRRTTKIGLSWVDLSSGDFFTQTSDLGSLPSLVARVGPREIVVDASVALAGQDQLQRTIGDGTFPIFYHQVKEPASSVLEWSPMLGRPVPEKHVPEFTPVEIAAGSLILDYIRDKVQNMNIQLQPPVRRSDEAFMAIDRQSLRNLEIRATLRDGTPKGSLLDSIRQTVTKSGARLLSQRIVSPSMSISIINHRLDLVQEMLDQDALREDIAASLQRTFDTYRLLQKFSIGRGDADDLLGLARTIQVMQQLSEICHDHILSRQDQILENGQASDQSAEMTFLWDILARLDLETPVQVAKSIQDAIDEDGLNQQQVATEASELEAEQMTEEIIVADEAGDAPPKLSRRTTRSTSAEKNAAPKPDEIWIMRRSASRTLQRTHEDLDSLVAAREDLAFRLRQETKIDSLSLKWTAQLGHFCHVKSKDSKGAIATLNGARTIASTKTTRSFYLSDWTHLGVRIDDAKLRIRTEEEQVFRKLRGHILENLMKLRRNAAVLDELDVACSSALVAKQRNLVRPILNTGTAHNIIGGRHPTVDVGLSEQGRLFTTNDCAVSGAAEQIYLITGPNMAGKSTYLRQNALITILAQTGCFVPAAYAEIGLVDKIFSRVGSADNLYQDQSTFMLEMLETAAILKSATPRSFVIMDEVGRGTTPEDGVAVGYACLHHLAHVNKSRALFATHFHALADMTRDFDRVAGWCTDVAEEKDGAWSYVHKLRRGVNRESHALKVARLAGLPESAVGVAAEVLAELKKEAAKRRGGKASLAALPVGSQAVSAAG